MREQESKKTATGKSEGQWKRSVKNLEQVTKALKMLSGITVMLNKRVRRAGRYLRTVLNFDEINRLNAPLKGEKSSKRSRRRSRRRSSGRRSGSTRRSGWNLGWAAAGVKTLGKWLKEVWKSLGKFFRSRKWTLPQGFERLAGAAKKLGAQLKGALDWGYRRVLKPLGEWSIKKAVPALVETLAKALELVSKVLETLSPLGKAVWDHFLAPLASFTGELVVNALEAVGNAFGLLSDVMSGLQNIGGTLGQLWDGLCDKAGALGSAMGGLFQGGVGQWLNDTLLNPLAQLDPLVKLKVAFEQGPADLWKSFQALWEQNPAVKTLVSLVKSGWESVSEWVKGFLGDGVSKAIGLVKSGWESVSEWVKGFLGDGVSKGIGLAKSGWSSVASWVRDHLGGGVNKGIGLAKSGWSSVSAWVKGSLGKALSFAVGITKGWKGSVAKALGLNKLSSKFNIKLPKVEVTWSGKPIKLPHFSLKWNAKGGILDGATLFGMAGNTLLGGGERGREAVLPLESNTGWMDRLADKVAERVGPSGAGGSAQPIRVQVVLDGRIVAESTVRELKTMARQGRKPLSGIV